MTAQKFEHKFPISKLIILRLINLRFEKKNSTITKQKKKEKIIKKLVTVYISDPIIFFYRPIIGFPSFDLVNITKKNWFLILASNRQKKIIF